MKIFRFLKPYWWQILLILGLTYAQVMSNLALPDYMASIIDSGIMKEDMSAIYSNGWQMLAVALGGAVAAVIVSYLAAKVATGFSRDLRKRTFKHIEEFSISEFDKFSTSSLITRTTNDIQQIQTVAIIILRMELMAPFMAVGALQKALTNAQSLSWVITLSTVLMLVLISTMFAIVLPKFKIVQALVDKLNLVTRENLTGLRVVRAFNKERYEEKKFDGVNKESVKLNLFVNRMMTLMQPAMTLIMDLAMLAIVWYGGHLVADGTIQIGNMMAFMQYAVQVIMSFLMISITFVLLPRAAVSAKRVMEVINTPASIIDPKEPKKLTGKNRGLVEFKDVTFTYPGAELPVITGINFVAKPGQTTAIIGSTGSGKSTIVNLIPRLYDVTAGEVLIDGVDVRNIKLDDLYKLLGYVPQKGVLFSGTVTSNINYGNPKADEDDIKRAARIAQASEFINKLDEKYDSSIAQGGSNVSGGQKQRLAIARALAVKPDIFIFDDSFSALDLKTDAKLREALSKETAEATVIIVAQRISTILDADNILVVDSGKIVGQGTHDSLMKSCKIYQEIAHSQLSDKELLNIAESHHKAEK